MYKRTHPTQYILIKETKTVADRDELPWTVIETGANTHPSFPSSVANDFLGLNFHIWGGGGRKRKDWIGQSVL